MQKDTNGKYKLKNGTNCKFAPAGVILALFVFVLFACEPYSFESGKHSYFIFDNNSSMDIAVGYDMNNLANQRNTIYVFKDVIKANKEEFVVYANSMNKHIQQIRHNTWEILLKDARTDTLKLFVLDYAKIRDYPTDNKVDSVPFYNVFICRYDLTIRNLDNLNWTLSYPPDERMKYVKMYPPYGE